MTVYHIYINGRHVDTSGTWSQAESIINKYEAIGKKNVKCEEKKV